MFYIRLSWPLNKTTNNFSTMFSVPSVLRLCCGCISWGYDPQSVFLCKLTIMASVMVSDGWKKKLYFKIILVWGMFVFLFGVYVCVWRGGGLPTSRSVHVHTVPADDRRGHCITWNRNCRQLLANISEPRNWIQVFWMSSQCTELQSRLCSPSTP